jgi:uncharacterized protein
VKIDITNLKDGETLQLEHVYDAKELNLELKDLRYLDALKMKGTLERVQNSLFFRGGLATELELVCTRCVKVIRQPVREPFDLYYPFTNQEFLETTNEIREVMILSYPVKVLCKESCKGLCPGCGADLNRESCTCVKKSARVEESPFGHLADWYKKKHGT